MKESFHEAKDLEKILKEISIEFKMEYELSDSCFKVFSKEIKVEGKISDKGEIVLTDSIIKEEDNMFSVYKTFLILVIIVFLIVVIMNDTFFLIEKILYSVVLLLVLIFHSFFGKLLSVFLLPYYNSESELKLKRLKLKLIDKLK